MPSLRTTPELTLLLLVLLTGASRAAGPSPDDPPPPRFRSLPGLESFQEMFRDFVEEQGVASGSLAVAYRGRLLLLGHHGWSGPDREKPVDRHSRFRIASLSKPLTGALLLNLQESGKLSLDDSVHELLELGRFRESVPEMDPRWEEITLRQLLQHTGGFDRRDSFDPMFRAVEFAEKLGIEPPAGPEDVIRAMLDVPLDFDPGKRYAYSNFGYCLLGRVVERVTGKTYEAAMRERVLEPLGIRSMTLGRSRLEHRQENEVYYHGTAENPISVFGPEREPTLPAYGTWNIEAMDAHGGWISNAVDLIRFITAMGPHARTRLLSPISEAQMFRPPPGKVGYGPDGKPHAFFYGLGWMNRPKEGEEFNFWHTGSLDGTAALMVSRHDGWSWAVLFSQRNGKGQHLGRSIDSPLHQAANAVEKIPDGDLFRELDREDAASGSSPSPGARD